MTDSGRDVCAISQFDELDKTNWKGERRTGGHKEQMKRILAWVLVILMLGQMIPGASFAASGAEETAEGLYEVVSDPAEKPVYHTVTFTADEEEVSTIFAADGAEISKLPEAPEIDGEDFVGWYDGDQPFTTGTEIHENKSVLGVYKEKEDASNSIQPSCA